MSRILTMTVLPKSADRWVALVGGGGAVAAAAAVTLLALPQLPAAAAFAGGIGLGVAGMVLIGVVARAFRRPSDAAP